MKKVTLYNTTRSISRLTIITLILVLVLAYFVYDSVQMRDEIRELTELNDIYEAELNTYRDMLADEEENNAYLSAENNDLKYDLFVLENEMLTLESILADFEKEHVDCRRQIVYSSENVLIPSNVTPEELAKGLRYNLRNYAEYFVEAEKEYGVNAIFLASIAAHESGWGRSKLAVNKNNLFGYKQAGGGGSFRDFETTEECILYVARVLKNSYLTEGAKYYNGTSVAAVNIKYCSSKDWAPQVNLIAKKIMDKIVEE